MHSLLHRRQLLKYHYFAPYFERARAARRRRRAREWQSSAGSNNTFNGRAQTNQANCSARLGSVGRAARIPGARALSAFCPDQLNPHLAPRPSMQMRHRPATGKSGPGECARRFWANCIRPTIQHSAEGPLQAERLSWPPAATVIDCLQPANRCSKWEQTQLPLTPHPTSELRAQIELFAPKRAPLASTWARWTRKLGRPLGLLGSHSTGDGGEWFVCKSICVCGRDL